VPPTKDLLEYCLILIAVIGTSGGVWNRIMIKRGIGLRFVQFLGVTVLVPIFALLSLESRISEEMTGAIAAAAVGGVLAGFARRSTDDEE
jgi:hypothetical protein